jgi:hypothetical protein
MRECSRVHPERRSLTRVVNCSGVRRGGVLRADAQTAEAVDGNDRSRRKSLRVRTPRFLVVVVSVAGVASGSVADSVDGASSPRWRFSKLTSLTWSFSKLLETETLDGASCRTRLSFKGMNSAPVIVGVRPDGRDVRFGKTPSTLNFGPPERSPVIPAQMTLTVGETACDATNGESCAGTFRARGAVVGGFVWAAATSPTTRDGFHWSFKMNRPDPLPPDTCGPELGPRIFEYFYGGIYHRLHGGVQRGAKQLPLPRSRLLAGKRFTTHYHAVIPASTDDASGTFVPVGG